MSRQTASGQSGYRTRSPVRSSSESGALGVCVVGRGISAGNGIDQPRHALIGGAVDFSGERLPLSECPSCAGRRRCNVNGAVNPTVALAKTAGSALLRARTITNPPAGIMPGDVYEVWSESVCEFSIVPATELPPTISLTSQVTLGSYAPVTVAWKAWTAPSVSVAEEGEMET
jgi:hypothetical protein